jgi:hypothetical protein
MISGGGGGNGDRGKDGGQCDCGGVCVREGESALGVDCFDLCVRLDDLCVCAGLEVGATFEADSCLGLGNGLRFAGGLEVDECFECLGDSELFGGWADRPSLADQNFARISGQLISSSRCQVLSLVAYPSHLMRYIHWPFLAFLQSMIRSTAYSSSSSSLFESAAAFGGSGGFLDDSRFGESGARRGEQGRRFVPSDVGLQESVAGLPGSVPRIVISGGTDRRRDFSRKLTGSVGVI